MKQCEDCKVDMLDDIEIKGQHPFEIGIDGESRIRAVVKGKGIFSNIIEVKSRVCPKCGKIELYIDPNHLK